MSRAERERIARLIGEMESHTTGEIHVHIAGRVGKESPLLHAQKTFKKLGLDKTDGRNAVLILIFHLDHQFAIWGDEGIHSRTGQHLWEKAKQTLLEHFKERRYPDGIEACVREVGRELAVHFPRRGPGPGKNQISNDVTES